MDGDHVLARSRAGGAASGLHSADSTRGRAAERPGAATAERPDATARVDRVLETFFRDAKNRALTLGPRYVDLWSTLERGSVGGKRFRPRMVIAAYESLGGTDDESCALVGAAFELLHTALIVHDDVIDRDFSRRGIPNVSGRYRDTATTAGIPIPTAEHRGMSAAVIAGDLALTGASRLLLDVTCDHAVRAALLDLLDEAIFASAGGELLDIELALATEMPSVPEILQMERAKTAVYSFEAPLMAGAALAGAAPFVLDALQEFGREIGVAYQLVDDLLGVFGTEAETGKTTLGDLREGKRTVLVAHAATTDDWFAIRPFIGKPDLTEDEAAHVRSRLELCGAKAAVESLIADHVARARLVLERSFVPDDLRDVLRPVIDTVVERVR
ncbi:polyprenyl synthetase family protein [Frondihabitans australicus]|uniref:Geranylgeranyl diphosphate synthase type II n=1 Tax=Frondihabitans australicus TaxID=386892 RepID=A0A495IJF5_9MICO|nr:polyprenyl synthetase family protein [Frondihabitans australicus]RKR76097.1 geranylgeranyl diphosphate synthase type II [Frondihabitans australicus]